jgi:hypothetical protein
MILGSCFANKSEYYVHPNGTFIYESRNFGPYYISEFQLDSCEIYNNYIHGKIDKLNEWTQAYKFIINDEVISSHYSYLFSFGSLFDSCKYFDVYDNTNTFIGSIEGNFSVEASAEFLFYDKDHQLFAKAYINSSNPQITISSPEGQPLITGIKIFHDYGPFYNNPSFQRSPDYYWKIKMNDNGSLDPRFLWPFIGFISEVWWYESPD